MSLASSRERLISYEKSRIAPAFQFKDNYYYSVQHAGTSGFTLIAPESWNQIRLSAQQHIHSFLNQKTRANCLIDTKLRNPVPEMLTNTPTTIRRLRCQ